MRIFIALCCLLALLAPRAAESRDVIAGPLTAEVLEVLDGDTLAVRLKIWLGHSVETKVRIAGMDTPEKRGKCGRERRRAEEARRALAGLLSAGKVRLSDIRHEKYAGRVLAKAATVKGEDIAGVLIEKGLARPYHGKKRAGWCG